MDDNFKTALKEICTTAIPAALVTITQAKGSTPRKAGAKMLITGDGQTFGTIGGGCGEAEVRREALNVLTEECSATYVVNMTNELAEEEGMVCGGIMEVFIDYLPAEPAAGVNSAKSLLLAYLNSVEQGETPVLVTVIKAVTQNEVPVGLKLLLAPNLSMGDLGSDKLNLLAQELSRQVGVKPFVVQLDMAGNQIPAREMQGGCKLLIEPTPPPVDLVVLGGGHIALPLCNMAKMLGYRVTVVDDRPLFANVGRFTGVDQVICQDFSTALKSLPIGPHTYIVIVTRGHKHDKECLSQVITRPAAYIGMIGSRRRVKALLAELHAEGIDTAILEQVYSPIGLDIAAETPEEIAVSILGELVKIHRGGKAQSSKLLEVNLEGKTYAATPDLFAKAW